MEDIYYYDADDQAEYDMMRKDEETHMQTEYIINSQ